MGVNDREGNTGGKGRQKKASGVDWGKVGGAISDNRVCWLDVEAATMQRLTDLATKRGMAVSYSAGANGDWVAITFLDGENRPRYYCTSPDQAQIQLEALCGMLAG